MKFECRQIDTSTRLLFNQITKAKEEEEEEIHGVLMNFTFYVSFGRY
jgi:hypothetical protein